MPSFRSIFAALLVSALVVLGVSGQTTTCASTNLPQCTTFTITTPSGDILLGITYDSAGDVCSVTGNMAATSAPVGNANIVALTTAPGVSNTVSVQPVNGVEELISISVAFTAQMIGGAGTTATATLVGNIVSGGATLTFTPLFASPQRTNAATPDVCSGGAAGDPLFKGFYGQQFYVEGKDGQVLNMLSTFNMQLNGRFVTLNEGEAMYPYQQEKLQLESQIAHQTEPAVAAFPKTTPWNHPGNYFGEIGVALLDDNRLHAKAGAFGTGFSKVTLNGRPMPVSDDFVVFGQGSNTTFVQRVSAHELMVRTVNVEFTVINSDNFLNVERVHLERGSKKFNHFSGVLGFTANNKWTWNPEAVETSVVESNNLFERTLVEA